MQILITGIAGFIGSYTAKKLVEAGHLVQGIDNNPNEYLVELKKTRIKGILNTLYNYLFEMNIEEIFKVHKMIKKTKLCVVINLVAQSGIRLRRVLYFRLCLVLPYKYEV
jgi:UDP-glucuronate 4-epimerase